MRERLLITLLGLLWLSQQSLAQGGYNYGNPTDAANVVVQTTTNPLRPIGPGFSTTAPSGVNAFPTAATVYGVGRTGTAFGGFGAQGQRIDGGAVSAGGFTPVPTTGYTGSAGGLLQRPTLPQRTAGGIFGGGQSQYAAPSGRDAGVRQGASSDEQQGDYSAIPGAPGVDYPVYSQVPTTNFDCAQQPLPGYYADVEALCQVFHICALNRTYSFLCPNGTIFSQETLVCVWWNQYNCAAAPSLYANNAFIYDYGPDGVLTNAAYQLTPNQIAVRNAASAARPQTISQVSSTGRTPTAPGSIFGAGTLRGGVGSGSNYPSGAGLVGTTNVGQQRYTPSSPDVTSNAGGAQAAFPIASTVNATPAPFGTVLRTAGGGAGLRGSGGGPAGASYGNAQLPASSANREYLPPGRP